MIVENHPQIDGGCALHNLVHHLQCVQSNQIGISGLAVSILSEVGGNHGVLHHLIGERQADGVIAVALNLVQNGVIVLRPQPVNDAVGRLKAIPVDSRHAHRLIVGVKNLMAAGVPIAGTLSVSGRRNQEQAPAYECPECHLI